MAKSLSKSKAGIRVLLADDHHLVRAGIRQLFESAGDLQVIAEAGDGAEAELLIEKQKPDVAVLDIQMPKATGIEITRWVRANMPGIGVLILTAYNDDPYAMAVLQAGANGYVLKTASPEVLIKSVHDVHEGISVLDGSITSRIEPRQNDVPLGSLRLQQLDECSRRREGNNRRCACIGRELVELVRERLRQFYNEPSLLLRGLAGRPGHGGRPESFRARSDRRPPPRLVDVSRLFIYYNERVMENTVNSDSGAQIRDGMKVVAKLGAPPETDWPYDIEKFTVKPPAIAYTHAAKNQVLSYQRVNRSLAQMKGCLAAGFPFVFGFTVYDSFESATVAHTGHANMPQPGEAVAGQVVHRSVSVGGYALLYGSTNQCRIYSRPDDL